MCVWGGGPSGEKVWSGGSSGETIWGVGSSRETIWGGRSSGETIWGGGSSGDPMNHPHSVSIVHNSHHEYSSHFPGIFVQHHPCIYQLLSFDVQNRKPALSTDTKSQEKFPQNFPKLGNKFLKDSGDFAH